MCTDCGCSLKPPLKRQVSGDSLNIRVFDKILSENDRVANHNRTHFNQHNVLVINLMSSPGSGKTSLLESTITELRSEFSMAVIIGDLETDNDARRIRAKGVPALQITTGQACHLDARLIHNELHKLELDKIDILFIENIGNLVCPAGFDLGQHRNVTLLSVTEGDDKPAKYPIIFRAADLVLLTKLDLLAYMDDFDLQRANQCLNRLAKPLPRFTLTVKNRESLTPWLDWLRQQLAINQSALKKENSSQHARFTSIPA